MSDFETPEEEAVVDYLSEALEEVNDWFEHDDFSVGYDASGKLVVKEHADNGYDGFKVINTYDVEIKVKRRERISD